MLLAVESPLPVAAAAAAAAAARRRGVRRGDMAGGSACPTTKCRQDPSDMDYVVWQSDQDAYAFTGQKCSAQSIMFMHENWTALGVEVGGA